MRTEGLDNFKTSKDFTGNRAWDLPLFGAEPRLSTPDHSPHYPSTCVLLLSVAPLQYFSKENCQQKDTLTPVACLALHSYSCGGYCSSGSSQRVV